VLDNKATEAEKDVNGIAAEVRAARVDMAKRIDDRSAELEHRFDRMIATGRWVIGLSIPAICTLLGILIGSTQ
jgi:predicted neutral ceramidase superfamily lipid hydrolase